VTLDLAFTLMSPSILAICFLGVVLGTTLGALPGLTATMGVTLIVPFTYGLDVMHSFALLLGVYVSGIYGGSISAILIRTPGTPSSAATLIDGYPMAQRGEAGRALGIASLSSFAGGIFSVLCLALLAPLLAAYALRFGPPEFFALAFFGLTIIVTVSGNNLRRGAISGLIGLFFASVGIDPILGHPRFTFGIPQLLGGVNFVVALIGVFAIGEVLAGIENLDDATPIPQRLLGLLVSVRDTVRHWICLLTSALIGTFIGVLPGVGGTVAPWIAYDVAQKMDPKADFGKGIPQGIIAAETANNGSTGGAMITLLSLGIPGDVVTAILIGALMIQGLRPGPRLFVESPDVAYGIIALMFIANVFMLIVGLSGARVFAKVVSLPKRFLLPLVVTFSVLGAFAINNDPVDVSIMLGFGLFGYILRKANYPLPPLILGMVLGPIAESQFRRSLVIADGDYSVFFTRPISAVILGFSVLSVVVPLVATAHQERKKKIG
jgi:putative tricarboxylic transport membrane protein